MPNYSARVDRAREGMVRARIAQRLASEVVAPLRMVKQPEELTAIQAAAEIVDTTRDAHR